MDRLITTLFMPISADDKISIGASEELALIGVSKICRCQLAFDATCKERGTTDLTTQGT